MDDEYVLYVNPGESQRFQQVYASQVYGTFFTVQARFQTAERENPEGDYFIEKMDFEVINYKGILDIGLVDIQGPNSFRDKVEDPTLQIFQLQMRAMGPQQSENIPEYTKSGVAINAWISKGQVLQFVRTLVKLHDDETPLAGGIFDSEFYYREGLRKSNNYDPIEPKPQTSMDERSDSYNYSSGALCPKSKNYVM